MAVTIQHAFESAKDDGADETLVRPSNWNAGHVIRWTLNKLLKGGGPDADPTEIDPYSHPTTGSCPQTPKAHTLASHSPGRIDKTRLEATADKILKGAGIGSDMVEMDVPGGVPSGVIVMWHGLLSNIPAGWVLCDGNNNTPNLLARFVRGVATAATNPGATGGESTHTLTVNEMPSHRHGDAVGFPSTQYICGSAEKYSDINLGLCDNKDSYVDYAGGGAAHENKPPFYDVAFIMKI